MTPVTLTIGWSDLFGKTEPEFTEQSRRDRWASWLRLADDSCREYWTTQDGCLDEKTGERCMHLRGRSWCELIGLPATVNPYTTFNDSIIGMACMGFSFELEEAAS